MHTSVKSTEKYTCDKRKLINAVFALFEIDTKVKIDPSLLCTFLLFQHLYRFQKESEPTLIYQIRSETIVVDYSSQNGPA